MPESLNTRLIRWYFNLFPAYWGTGARVSYIAADWKEIRIRLPLSWQTRNVVGVIFGGSLYASVDPFYMIMLMKLLGPEYEIWDKAAHIRFKRPGRSTLYAHFQIDEAELDAIRAETLAQPAIDRVYEVTLADAAGAVHAVVSKTIFIRRRPPPPPAP